MKDAYIAVDFGASNGRVMAGTIDSDNRLHLTEVHRFVNRHVPLGNHDYWDFLYLFREMLYGLRKAVTDGFHILSIGIDTWGVDFGLIDRLGNLISNPICYRDKKNDGCSRRFYEKNSAELHYSESGIQALDINSLYRLSELVSEQPDLIEMADKVLFMPDLFAYFLTGVAANEYTIASTSGLLDATKRDWNKRIFEVAGIPSRLFSNIIMPGETLGLLKPEIKEQIEVDYDIPVVEVGTHDTQSAIFSVSGTYESDRTAFLSSGTWSLLGVVLNSPRTDESARTKGFSNEGGIDGQICLLQNITGLWLLQNLMREWESDDYETILKEAEASEFTSEIDVEAPDFVNPRSMSAAIVGYCEATGQKIPVSRGDFVRCVLQSLAKRYSRGIENLNSLLPDPVKRLQIIGGGSRNHLLNRLTEEATGLPVSAGPVEATAVGNILIQIRSFHHKLPKISHI